MNKEVRLTIPGKLFLAGEYAVTTPGQPALIAAVDHGMTIKGTLVEVSDVLYTSKPNKSGVLTKGAKQNNLNQQSVQTTPSSSEPLDFSVNRSWDDSHITVHSEQFDEPLQVSVPTIASWSTQDIKENTWAFVKAALAIVVFEHGDWFKQQASEITLAIHSEMKTAEGKLGLGSSAAVTVAVVSALHRLFASQQAGDETVDAKDAKLKAIFKEAAFAHYLVQGSGSLGDLAASSHTGLIYYQAPAWIKQVHARNLTLADFKTLDWTNLAIKKLNWPNSWQLSILATKEPASTKKALGKKVDRGELLPHSANAVQKAKAAFEAADYDALKQALDQNQDALVDALPAEYLTSRLKAFLALKNDYSLAGKVSGAGFGDNGFWLTERPLTEDEDQQVEEAGLSQIKTTLFEA
ncbi:hypothetical protein NFX39_00705 [Fructobacillus sp. W13]|uniref:phosphomevalonate kinase n=1 Tax=Fructobacillus apis TaxID=2935017 RepID=A0ABT0ZNQ4_9LACO|nr:hypothetical protein [Fructobacillus apis]MCO0831616.1 hypothetical protein [Fructobacillus apis]